MRKSRAALSVIIIDFDREQKRLLTILHRDIQRLMDDSHTSRLSKQDSEILSSYLKLVSEQKALKLLEDAERKIGKK